MSRWLEPPYVRPWIFFQFLLLLWALFCCYYIYRVFFRGHIGPLWGREAMIEEWMKEDVAREHDRK